METTPASKVQTKSSLASERLVELLVRGTKWNVHRFILAVVFLNTLFGVALVVFEISESSRSLRANLEAKGEALVIIAKRLYRMSSALEVEAIRTVAGLSGNPMALFSKDGVLKYHSNENIMRRLPMVYKDKPLLGCQLAIDRSFGHLSGAWLLSSFNKDYNLLVIVPQLPENGVLSKSVKSALWVGGLGLCIGLIVMLGAAYWFLRRPLLKLVIQYAHVLGRDVFRIKEVGEQAVSARQEAEQRTAFHNQLINASQIVGIVAADIDDRIQIFNRTAEKILGFNAVDIIGKLTLSELDEQRNNSSEPPKDNLCPDIPAAGRYEFWVDHQGQQHLLDVSRSDILDEKGQRQGSLVSFIERR